MIKTNPDNIDIINSTGSFNDAGEFIDSQTTIINVKCDVQFNNRHLKVNVNGRDIIFKGIVYVTEKSEIDKLVNINIDSEINISGEIYKMLQYYKMQKHCEIYF